MVHTTIGLYLNGDFKVNGVLPEHLESHVAYNKSARFGRALFVDGTCVYNGYLKEDQIKAFEDRIRKENIKQEVCTAPYQ